MKLNGTTTNVNNLLATGTISKSGGTSAQFLKADGSIDSTTYLNRAGDNSVPGSFAFDVTTERYLKALGTSINWGFFLNSTACGIWDWQNSRGILQYIASSNTTTLGSAAVSTTGTMTASSFIGSAANLTSATLPLAVINATGTKDATTYLRGDGVWTTPTASAAWGSITGASAQASPVGGWSTTATFTNTINLTAAASTNAWITLTRGTDTTQISWLSWANVANGNRWGMGLGTANSNVFNLFNYNLSANALTIDPANSAVSFTGNITAPLGTISNGRFVLVGNNQWAIGDGLGGAAKDGSFGIVNDSLTATPCVKIASNGTVSIVNAIKVGSWSGFGTTYSACQTVVGNNIYIDPNDVVSGQLRYQNTHSTYGQAFVQMSYGLVEIAAKREAVTAGAVVTKNVIAGFEDASITFYRDLTLTGTNTKNLYVQSNAGHAYLWLNSGNGSYESGILFQKYGTNQWELYDGTSSGNFYLYNYGSASNAITVAYANNAITLASHLYVNGSDSQIAGGLSFTTSTGGNRQGTITYNSGTGMSIWAKTGSTYDFCVWNTGGSAGWVMPTGTSNFVTPGIATFGSANTTQITLLGGSSGASSQRATIGFSDAGQNYLDITTVYPSTTNVIRLNPGGSTMLAINQNTSIFSNNTARTFGSNSTLHDTCYFSSSAGSTGTIKITLPVGWTSTMCTFTIKGYDYSSMGAWEVIVGGYNYSGGPYWTNQSATGYGTLPFSSVRLAYDGAKCCILLGTTSTVFQYPQIVVTEAVLGYSNFDVTTTWAGTWTISQITSEAGITSIADCSLKTSVNSSNIGSQSVSYATTSGRVGFLNGRTDNAAYPVLWGADQGGGTTYGFACSGVTINSATATLAATTLSASGSIYTGSNFYCANTNYGIFGNTGVFDTIDSGYDTDPLEICYSKGPGIIIGTSSGIGGTKYIKSGYIATSSYVNVTSYLYCDQNYGSGMVGLYHYTKYRNVYSMGDSYKPALDGTTTGSHYGIGYAYEGYFGVPAGLGHCLTNCTNGSVTSAVGSAIWTSGNITAYSDERLKTNWRNLPSDFVQQLAKVKNGIYDRIDKGYEGLTQVGVSAQSLQPVMPNAIIESKDEMNTLSVAYGNAAMASAVELAKELVKQQDRINSLEQQLVKVLALLEAK